MKATIYIPEDKAKVYEDAKEKLGESISKTFVECLERKLENAKLKTGRIVVPVYDKDTGRVTKKCFEGRFLIGGLDRGEDFYYPENSGIQNMAGCGGYSVALMKADRLAVLHFDSNGQVICFDVLEDFDELSNAEDSGYEKYPPSLVQAVGAEVGVEIIEDLDI